MVIKLINKTNSNNKKLTTKEIIKKKVETLLSKMIMENGKTGPFKKSYCVHMYLMWGYEWLIRYLTAYAFPKLDMIGPKKSSKKKVRLRLLIQLQKKNARHFQYPTYPRKYLDVREALDNRLRLMIQTMSNGKTVELESIKCKNIGKNSVRCNFNHGRDY